MSIITPRSNSSPFSAFLRTRSLSLLRFIIPSLSVISLIWVLFHHSRSGLNATLSQAFQKLRPSSSSSPPPPRVIIKLDPKNFTDEALLGLPILPRTSNDPFDPLNQYRALPDSYTPWNESTSRGSILLDRLRQPPISKPPPTEIWPPSTLVQPRFIKPIPHDQILHFSDASSSTLPLIPHSKNSKSFQVQWSGFKHPRRSWETRDQEKIRNQRRTWVKNAFLHNWESYKSQAWGHDELMPVSGNFQDPFCGWGATLVDSLDTLLIMNLPEEYKYARAHVRKIDWSHVLHLDNVRKGIKSAQDPSVPFFETVIRYLGGLMSAYELSGDSLMLKRAEELANWLLPAFATFDGFPILHYQLGTNPAGAKVQRMCLAEVGSLSLEFTRLSQLTKKPEYYFYAQRITDNLNSVRWRSPQRLGTLFPTSINPRSPKDLLGDYTFAGSADSYYEYLIKEHQLLGGDNPQYQKTYIDAIESAKKYLIEDLDIEGPGSKHLTLIGANRGQEYIPELNHLSCFSGAMLGLGARLLDRRDDLDLAVSHTDTCVWAYESTKTGLGAEGMIVRDQKNRAHYWEPVEFEGKIYRQMKPGSPSSIWITNAKHIGRPETIESVFYMWRITGDRMWQDRGWRMFTNWVESCLTEYGFANIEDVDRLPPLRADKQESFVLAETLKYYYLLFEDPNVMSLDENVFNTEAHAFYVGSDVKHHEKLKKKYGFELEDSQVDHSRDGKGTVLQTWAGVNVKDLNESEKAVFENIIGV